jgi:hypothetical protein
MAGLKRLFTAVFGAGPTVATVLHMSKASYHLVPSVGSDPISYSQTEISVLDVRRGYLSLL